MKERIKNIIRRTGTLWNESLTRNKVPSILNILEERARLDSVDFLESKLNSGVLFRSVSAIRNYAIQDINEAGLILEFGVFKGSSIRQFAKNLSSKNDQRTIVGFDSFEGLEEAWTGQVGGLKSKFSTLGVMPSVPSNVHLLKGLVQDTLPKYLETVPNEQVAFIHCDLDTYTPTKFVLEYLKDRCVSGTVILFDELYGYPNWRHHEYRALMEVFNQDEYEYIAFCNLQCAIRFK
ncbi:class I SAM-dependent methyltransferase [Magnetovibrio blakemorei]|nr:class I SAM-dependent methyltransferase [Magnetovibrio blakemorei]